MVVDERGGRANRQSNSEPKTLPLNKKINVAMTITRKSAGAKKHDDADDEHAQNSDEQDVSAFSVHRLDRHLFFGIFPIGEHRLPACGARQLAEHDSAKTEIRAHYHLVLDK